MTIHEAVKAYFEPKVEELVGDILSFNFSPESRDSFALVTNYSGKIISEYVTGDKKKAYGFAIVIVKNYSTDGDDLNLQCMNFVQSFMEWLEMQTARRGILCFQITVRLKRWKSYRTCRIWLG